MPKATQTRIDGEPSGEDAVFLASHHLRGSRPKEGLPHLTPALEHLGEVLPQRRGHRSGGAGAGRSQAAQGQGARGSPAQEGRAARPARGAGDAARGAGRGACAGGLESEDAALRAKVRVAGPASEPDLGLRRRAGVAGAGPRPGPRGRRTRKYRGPRHGEPGERLLVTRAATRRPARSSRGHLALAREIGDRQGEAGATGGLGNVFLSQGRYEEAGAQYEKWLALAREIGDRRGEAVATGNLGTRLLEPGPLTRRPARSSRSTSPWRARSGTGKARPSPRGTWGASSWQPGPLRGGPRAARQVPRPGARDRGPARRGRRHGGPGERLFESGPS